LDQGGDPKLVLAGGFRATPPFPDQADRGRAWVIRYIAAAGRRSGQTGLYALSTVIFPSLYEGFGMMVLEAMEAGTYVVTSGP
jgi:glycosyltransferase involved in cell wall biosynthesis